jgi:5-bromo-4-chloroindolyl phosphate hydrolysis protein
MKVLSEKDIKIKAGFNETLRRLNNLYQKIKQDLNFAEMNEFEKIQNNLQMFLKHSEKDK